MFPIKKRRVSTEHGCPLSKVSVYTIKGSLAASNDSEFESGTKHKEKLPVTWVSRISQNTLVSSTINNLLVRIKS